MAGSYPAHREADITLRDGSTLHVRPLRPADRDGLLAFFATLSEPSRAFRFFSPAVSLDRIADMLADVDYVDRYGIVATGADGRFLAHGAYVRTTAAEADVAFAVADELQGRGVATTMLAHLSEAAAEVGIEMFTADVMATNHHMIEVFRESGFPVETSSEPGSIVVRLPTSLSAEAVDRFEDRDRIAAVAAMRHVLEPSSIAVIGASRDPDTVGGRLFHNLLSGSFTGPVYPVNRSAQAVQAVRAYPSVGELPEAVELAVIAVPAAAVVAVARECAAAGVMSLLVISAGFAEVGAEGAERQRELLAICREFGIRLVGPNCLGGINTAPEYSLNATFAPAAPPPGTVGLMTQSGALGLALIEHSRARRLGVSSFASVGNKADISGNDLLAYWEQDETTEVILLYLESFGNPRKFSRLGQRIARRKPIVAVKSGRSAPGARAAGSHTGALLEASDVTVDALFRQAGVIRTDGLAELLDVASLLAKQPPPKGDRVAIITNAGGPGIMCADACEATGLEVAELPADVRRELSEFLAPEAALGNPVDMIATAPPEHYRRTLEVVARSGAVDAMIAIFVRPLLIETGDVAKAIDAAISAQDPPLPTIFVMMSPDAVREAPSRLAPTFAYPEDAAPALARVVRYARWRERPPAEAPSLDGVNGDAAAAAIAHSLAAGGGWMAPEPLDRLLSAYGLPVVTTRRVDGAARVGAVAAEIGVPVAVKAVAAGLVHKTEAGAVRTDVDPSAAAGAAAEIEAALADRGVSADGFVVQEMAPPGPEILVGVTHNPLFGPVVACGAGGVEAELIRDVAVRLTPLGESDAREMLESLATYPRLSGFRGAAPVDTEGLVDLLLRVGAMAEAHAEIVEMDLNPVIPSEHRVAIVDARVRVEAVAPSPPWPTI